MPQTLIAVIAMAMASLVSFQQHRSVLEQRMNSIRGSLAVRSTAVATDKLEEIGAKAFDQATVAGAIASSALLNPIAEVSVASVLDDVSDYHGLVQDEKREANGIESSFKVKTLVAYVSEADGQTAVGYSTKLKKVTVTVVPDGLAKPDTIRISEVVSCGVRCAW